MTTTDKFTVAFVGGACVIITAISAFFMKRIDDRSEAEFQAYMRNLESRADTLEESNE